MRNLLLFMIIAGVFVLGRNSCNGSNDGFHFGSDFFGMGTKGEGPVTTELRTPGEFTQITNKVSADVEWRTGEAWQVEISAQANLIPLIKTEIKNGALIIYTDDSYSSKESIVVKIISPELKEVHLAGSGNFKTFSPVKTENFSIHVAGSGTVEIADMDVQNLNCHVAGSGDVNLTGGTAQLTEAHVAGSGNVQAKAFSTGELKAHVAGSGDIACGVREKLDASVGGSGTIRYYGNPEVKSHVGGSGEVVQER